MAICVVDKTSYFNGAWVYGLQYDDEDELTGDELTAKDEGDIVCRPGSLAWKAGGSDKMQLDNSGEWVSGE